MKKYEVIDCFNVNEDDKREIYGLTHANADRCIDHKGETVNVAKWLLYRQEETDSAGNILLDDDGNQKVKNVIVIDTGNGFIGTASDTFIDSFCECTDAIGKDLGGGIIIRARKSKSGREFVECTL